MSVRVRPPTPASRSRTVIARMLGSFQNVRRGRSAWGPLVVPRVRSARPGRADDAFDRRRALEAGDEVLEHVGVHGAVRGLGAVLEPVDVRPQKLVLEVPSWVDGEDLAQPTGFEAVQAVAEHVG